MKGIGGHHRPYRGATNEWFTPPEILAALGKFDDDPCKPNEVNGLVRPWNGRVWLNPPYGPETGKWLLRLAEHGNGMAIIFARTETKMFFSSVWERATAVLFIRGRLHFYRANGERAKANSGAPSVLIAYGALNAQALINSKIPGYFVFLGRGHGFVQ